MNQPQNTAQPEPQEITVRIDINVAMGANMANLTALVDKTKPVIEEAKKLGEVTSHAMFGRQKLAI
jgi:hypothetical protein